MTTRPAVKVQRQFAATPAAVEPSSLNAVIIGPAYHLMDYPADIEDIHVGAYGSSESDSDGSQNGRPVLGSPELVLSEPPENATGAILVEDSVAVYLGTAYLELATGTDGTKTLTSPDEDLFYTFDTEVDFAASGVRPGDRIVVTDDSGAQPGTLSFVVQEVGGWLGSSLLSHQLRTYSNLDKVGTTLTSGGNGSYKWRIERVATDILVPGSFVQISGNAITIGGGIYVAYDADSDGTDEVLPVNAATTVYVQYKSLRQDLTALASVENTDDITTTIGPIDERNPLSVGLSLALLNTITEVFYIGVSGDNINGTSDRITAYQSALDSIETRLDLYVLTPLTTDYTVISAYKTACEALAEKDISNFRAVLGSTEELPLISDITDDAITGVAEVVAGDPVDVYARDFPTGGFSSSNVQEGDVLTVLTGSPHPSHAVSKVFDEKRLQLVTPWAGGAAIETAAFYILRGAGPALGSIRNARLRRTGGLDRVQAPVDATADTALIGQVFRLADARDMTSADYQEQDGNYLVQGAHDGQAAELIDPGTKHVDYTARTVGDAGNDITIELAVAGLNTPLSVAVVGTAVTVNLATDGGGAATSTAQEVIDAIAAHVQADGLMIASITSGGAGGTVQVLLVETNLDTGSDTYYDVLGDGTFEDQVLLSAVLADPSTAYDPNDELTLVGGTFTTAAKIKVLTVDSGTGAILTYEYLDHGDYSVPPASPIATTNTGTGTGATLTGTFGESTFYGVTSRGTQISSATAVAQTFRQAYRRLRDDSAAFATQLLPVIVSDLVSVPTPPGAGNSDYDATVDTSVVSQVIGDNRLLMSLGEDIATDQPAKLETEDTGFQDLPHYLVSRSLDRNGQVEALSTITEGLASMRAVMVWPPEVLLSGVVNASTGQRTRQPGYYLACILAGMTSGLPPQQGFTRLTISGIEKLYSSNFYFTIAQIDKLSAAGWFVFIQDSAISAPYSVHQLTTDPSSLETGEFSLVKNFDYVAATFKDALDQFIGKYNVVDETLDLVGDTLRATGQALTESALPKIGAPIRSMGQVLVQESATSADKIEATVNVTLPKPLNDIDITIVG